MEKADKDTPLIGKTESQSSKDLRYSLLVEARKKCGSCPGLMNPSKVCGGSLDSDEIGPWSRWHGDLNAEVVIVGQDFSNVSYFEANNGGDSATNQTNIRLTRFLKPLGYDLDPRARGDQSRLFFTNAILCLKTTEKVSQGRIQDEWLEGCGQNFLRPLIDLIEPKVVVTLGGHALRGIQRAYGLPEQPLSRVVNFPEGQKLSDRTQLFAVYHLSPQISNTATRTAHQQDLDWRRIVQFLSAWRSSKKAIIESRAVHQKTIESILDWLKQQPEAFVWPNEPIGIYGSNKKTSQKLKNKHHINGVSDILGIWQGRPLAIVVSSSKNNLTKEQLCFLHAFRYQNGLAIVACSIEDVNRQIFQTLDPL